MNLRAITTHRLLAVCIVVIVLGATGAAIAIAGGGPTLPPRKPLATVVRDAVRAPEVPGVTARIKFTNKLIDSSSLQGSDPLLTGAGGRVWISGDRVRLELQSDAGDAQILSDGKTASLYDAANNTVYRATLPREEGAREAKERKGPPSLARIQKGLNRLMQRANVSSARPSAVADRPAYTVRVGPKHDGGRLGAAELAWDAARGVPLRGAVYAEGNPSPVLELEATDISFGAVPASTFDAKPPARAKRVTLDDGKPGERSRKGRRDRRRVTGAAAVDRAVPFSLSAPGRLVGLPRQEVRLIDHEGRPGAVVTYGRGLGGIAVIQQATERSDRSERGKRDRMRDLDLPKVSINGATGEELDTALGTIVRFSRGGVDYTVLGSVPPAAAEAAARGL